MKKNISFLFIPVSIIVAGAIIAGAVFYSNRSPSVYTDNQEEKKSLAGYDKLGAVTENDHVRGNPDAPVTIVEFSDFECPFCLRFHPVVKRILEEYPNEVRWVYRHFPLDSIHNQARPAAEASECASEQGKFWEFADGLFENQERLGDSLYRELAQDLDLDMNQFDSCVFSGKYADKVEANYREGLSVGIRGTPGGFVNDQVLSGALPYEQLKALIDNQLK